MGLAVTADAWRVTGRDRLGEAFVRTALAGSLGVERAARAAAGWGNDSLLTVRRPGVANSSYAWVLQWDDPAEADEFRAAMADSIAARGRAADGGGWHVAGVRVALRHPGPETTVLFAGAPSFVRNATASADGGVALRLP
jgi:hypothetical protein